MAKYYCVLFDADNTLLDFDAAENKALADTLREYGIEPDAETVQTYRTINEELLAAAGKGPHPPGQADGGAVHPLSEGSECRRQRCGDEQILSGSTLPT